MDCVSERTCQVSSVKIKIDHTGTHSSEILEHHGLQVKTLTQGSTGPLLSASKGKSSPT